jgi:hypothetical protein
VQVVSHRPTAGGTGCHAGEKHRSSLLRTRSIRRAVRERKPQPGQKPGQFKQQALLAAVPSVPARWLWDAVTDHLTQH